MKDKLKEIQQRLNKVEERLSQIKFSNEIHDLEIIERKFESIKKNN